MEVLLEYIRKRKELVQRTDCKHCKQPAQWKCDACAELYCGEECQLMDWNANHQFECIGWEEDEEPVQKRGVKRERDEPVNEIPLEKLGDVWEVLFTIFECIGCPNFAYNLSKSGKADTFGIFSKIYCQSKS